MNTSCGNDHPSFDITTGACTRCGTILPPASVTPPDVDPINTLKDIELAEISLQAALDHVEDCRRALKEARRIHRVATKIEAMGLSDEDALEEMNDEGICYELGEAILAYGPALPNLLVTHAW